MFTSITFLLLGFILLLTRKECKSALKDFFSTRQMSVSRTEEVCVRESSYFHIRVYDELTFAGRIRHLCLNNVEHSALNLDHLDKTFYPYTDYFHLPWIFNEHPRLALVIGLGGGITPMRFTRDTSDLVCETVELDPMIVTVAKEYFGVKEDARNTLCVGDGREFLRHTQKNYDVIVMDAYGSGSAGPVLPPPLSTKEFFESIRSRLTASGVLAFNLIGQIQGQAPLALSVIRTAREVFPSVFLFPVDWKKHPDASLMRNIIVVCTREKEDLTPEDMLSRANKLVAKKTVKLKNLPEITANIYLKPLNLDGVQVLTDK